MFTRLKRSPEGFEPADLFSLERVKNFQGSPTSRPISCTMPRFHERVEPNLKIGKRRER